MTYWLFKSEPSTFSIDDLYAMPKRTDHWDGVRNYQARNFMRDEMQKSELGFFYHSNCKVPGIVGIVEITKTAFPDHTAFDSESDYYDPKSHPDTPRWFMVNVTFKEKFNDVIPLTTLKTFPELNAMPLLQKGNRLSVMPVDRKAWQFICKLAN